MANSLLSSDVVLKESLSVLHQELNFIPNIGLQYDDQFANSGAKIGSSVRIRMPNEFTVRSGANLSAQDVTERTETLTLGTQKGVDISFSSVERTMTIDEYSDRYIRPAMAALAADIESDALSMTNDVYNFIDVVDSDMSHAKVQSARAQLNKMLAPRQDRCFLHTPDSVTGILNSSATYFHDSQAVKQQFREGTLGRQGGFDHFENTLLSSHTTGTAAEGATSYLINNASNESADATDIANGYQSITVDGGTATFLAGDIITIVGVNRCHPETKADTGELQQFVVRANSGSSATTLSIAPAIITSGPRQNVTAAAADNAAIHKVGGGNGADWQESLAFQKDAFAIAFADLILPKGVHEASRQVLDGISMRMVTDYSISTDTMATRLDVFYGYKTVRPQLAVRVGHN